MKIYREHLSAIKEAARLAHFADGVTISVNEGYILELKPRIYSPIGDQMSTAKALSIADGIQRACRVCDAVNAKGYELSSARGFNGLTLSEAMEEEQAATSTLKMLMTSGDGYIVTEYIDCFLKGVNS